MEETNQSSKSRWLSRNVSSFTISWLNRLPSVLKTSSGSNSGCAEPFPIILNWNGGIGLLFLASKCWSCARLWSGLVGSSAMMLRVTPVPAVRPETM